MIQAQLMTAFIQRHLSRIYHMGFTSHWNKSLKKKSKEQQPVRQDCSRFKSFSDYAVMWVTSEYLLYSISDCGALVCGTTRQSLMFTINNNMVTGDKETSENNKMYDNDDQP